MPPRRHPLAIPLSLVIILGVLLSWLLPAPLSPLRVAPLPALAATHSLASSHTTAPLLGPSCLSTCIASVSQPLSLPSSDGRSWKPMDTQHLSLSLVPAIPCNALLVASADLLGSAPADLGITLSGGSYRGGAPIAWQERPLSASPPAHPLLVQTVLPLSPHTRYTVSLVWKSAAPTTSTLTAGGPALAPTRLSVLCRFRTSIFTTSTTHPLLLSGSRTTGWMELESKQLTLSLRPGSSCTALVLGGVDRWSTPASKTQDVGISVNGIILDWQEQAPARASSPLLLQSSFAMVAGTPYRIALQWKGNTRDNRATIPAGGAHLSLLCSPASFLQSSSQSQVPPLARSDGTTWKELDHQHLTLSLTPSSDVDALLVGESSLWSSQAGIPQDLGIAISGGSYKGIQVSEENGSTSPSSPNATLVQTILPLKANVPYTVSLQWKAGKATTGTIKAGTGTGTSISPTRLTALLVPAERPLPPDPGTTAPPVNPSVATTVANATSFLYSGPSPIQTGVKAGTINPIRAAVLRGKVLDGVSEPLAGVAISIANHSEYGQTLSRADGSFDLAVNGGGLLTVSYTKAGYLPIQRQAQATWDDYTNLPDAVMTPPDSQVTPVTLSSVSSAMQVAQGSVQQDGDGTRQATLLFQPGTTATMTMPDGSRRPLPSGHVRATEYTVGPKGQESMPGTLPPTEGYTYAADFSFDEAKQAGATGVQFNKAVISYTQDFLKWPVGLKVPSMYFDQKKGVWVEGASGVVLQILSVADGAAKVDVDGSGNPASDATLSTLGITPAELQQLARLYPVGQKLWRMPLDHFTDWDY